MNPATATRAPVPTWRARQPARAWTFERLCALADREGWHVELARYGFACPTCSGARQLEPSTIGQAARPECPACAEHDPVLLVLELHCGERVLWVRCPSYARLEDTAGVLLLALHRKGIA